MNHDEYIKKLSGGAPTPPAATPQGPQGIGLMESMRRRSGLIGQGNYADAFDFSKTPEATGQETFGSQGGLLGGIGQIGDTITHAMGSLSGAEDAAYRKSLGVDTAAPFSRTDLARSLPRGNAIPESMENLSAFGLNPLDKALGPNGLSKALGSEADKQQALYDQAVKAYQAGDKESAFALLDQYKKMAGVPGAAASTMAGLATDPMMAAGAMHRVVGAAMAPTMISGGVKGAQRLYQTGKEKGFTSQEFGMEVPDAAVGIGFGALTGTHLVKGAGAAYKNYKNRSGKTAPGDARAPFPSDSDTSTSGTTPADISAPRGVTPTGVPRSSSTAGTFSIPAPDPAAIKAPPLRSKIEGVAEAANDVLNRTISERTKKAHEGVNYFDQEGRETLSPNDAEIVSGDLPEGVVYNPEGNLPRAKDISGLTPEGEQGMPDTFGGGFNKEAAIPTKIKILDEATIQEFEKKFPGKDIRGSEAFQHAGTIYLGESYQDAVLSAKTPQEAISNAIGILAHERMHGTERADKYGIGGPKPDTARYNPMTGKPIEAEVPGPDGSMIPNPMLVNRPHARGGFNDNVLRDVAGAIQSRNLERTAEADPRIQQLRAQLEADPALAAALTKEGSLPGGGTYTPEVSQLAEGLAGENLAPGGRSWSESRGAKPERAGAFGEKEVGEQVEPASKTPVNEERVKNIGAIIAQRFGKLPSKEQASAVKKYLDGAVEHQAISPGERSAAFRAYREAIASPTPAPEAITTPPNPAAGKADAMIAQAKAEVESKPPVTVPKTQMSVDEAHERALRPAQGSPSVTPVKDPWARGNKHNKPDYVSRTEWLQKISDMGGPTAENLAKIGSSPEEYAARRKDVTSSRNPEYDKARGILSEHARLLAGRKLGKGASLRDLGLNKRRLTKELAGEDTSTLPKSSQDLSSPAASVRGVQAAVAEAKKAEKVQELLKKGSDPEVKKEAASRLDAIANGMRNAFLKIKGLSGAQATDVNNNITGLTKNADRLREVAEAEVARRARVTEDLRVKEYKAAQAAEVEKQKKVAAEAAHAKRVKDVQDKNAPVASPNTNDTVGQGEDIGFASPSKKRKPKAAQEEKKPVRLTADQAIAEARKLAAEVKDKQAERAAKAEDARDEQDSADARSIAQRDTDAGKKSRSTTVTKKGEVKRGADTIGKAARALKAGKKTKVSGRPPQGRKIATAADVAEWNAKRKKGAPKLSVGDPIPGTEAYSGPGHVIYGFAGHGRGSITKGGEVLGDVMEGHRMGQSRGDARDVAQRKVTELPGTPAVLPKPISEAGMRKVVAHWDRLSDKQKAYYRQREYARASAVEGPIATPPVPAMGHKVVTPQKPAVDVPKPEVPTKVKEKRAEKKAEIDARKEAARVAALDRIKTGQAAITPVPKGTPKLTEGPVTKVAGETIPEDFQRKDSSALAGTTKKAFEAKRQVTIAEEILKNTDPAVSPTSLIDAAVDKGRLSRANAVEMRGLNRKQLETFIADKKAEAEAYTANATEGSKLSARLGRRTPQSPQTMAAGGTNKLGGKMKGDTVVESEAAKLVREAAGKAAPAARTPESTTYRSQRYPTLESWANAGRPERALALAPQKAQMGARKPGTAGTEGHGDVATAMDLASTVGRGSNLFSKTSSTGKLYEKAGGSALEQGEAAPEGLTTEGIANWLREKRTASREKKAQLKLEAEQAREAARASHASGDRLAPRVGEGKRKLPSAIRNYSAIKTNIGKIAHETVGKGAAGRQEFMDRVDSLIKKRVEAGDILPGETVIKVRQGAAARFERERAATPVAESPFKRTETALERAERVLGGEGKVEEDIAPASPTLGRKKRAEQGDIFAQAGEEGWAGKPLNKQAENVTKSLHKLEEASGMTKNAITGGDVSAVFRNTLWLTTRQMASDPKGFAKNFMKGLTSYSEKHFDKHHQELMSDPMLQPAMDSNLRLSLKPTEHDLFANTDRLANWIHSGQKLGKLDPRKWAAEVGEKMVLGAARAYTMYQNAVMMDAFKTGVQSLNTHKELNPQTIREMTTCINMLASRHKTQYLKGNIERVANATIFSPQMIVSTVKTLSNLGIPAEIGPRILRGGREFDSVATRKMYQQSMRSTMAFGSSVLALTYFAAKAAGENPEIETNPLSNDYGTVRFGHNKVNPWGPHQQYIRLAAQLLTGKEKLRGSGRTQKANVPALLSRVARGKLSPLAGLGVNIGTGSTGAGRETLSAKGKLRAIGEAVGPINPTDLVSIYQENPPAMAALLSAMVTTGIGVTSGTGTKGWITDSEMSQADVRVSDEIRKHNLEPPRINSRVPLKGRNAVGQKLYHALSGEERENFTNEVMPLISKDIDKFISSDRYKSAPKEVQRKLLFRMIKRENARYSAAKRLKKTYAGATPVNDWWKDEEE